MKSINKNRGAALVTVLVVTTFLTVLVTSLVYMSYMNYMTKSMRHVSTDNFYTDEFALDDLASELQQYGTTRPKETAVKDIVKAVANDELTQWVPSKMDDFINIANEEADITVTAKGEPLIDYGSTYVTFRNVKITSKTKKGGYESSIVSDLSIAWPTVPKESYGVYDFSVITDAQIHLKTGDLGIGGCLYCKGTDTKPAILVDCGGTLALNGPVSVIHGDILVKDGGVLSITGKVYVTGSIKIEAGGLLYNLSDTVVYGGANAPDAKYVKGKADKIKQKENAGEWVAQFDDISENDTIAGDMVNEHLKVRLTGTDYLDVSTKPFTENNDGGFIFYNNQFYKESKPLKNGKKVKACVGLPVDVSNGLNNSLIISAQDMTIRGDCSNSTFISSSKNAMTIDIAGVPTFMQHMTEESYAAAKNILFCPSQKYMYNKNGYINKEIVLCTNYSTLNGGTIQKSTSNSWQKNRADYFDDVESDVISYTVGDDPIEYYYIKNTDENVIPIANLITPDAESHVAELLSIATGGGVKPDDSEIIYTNWYKE